MFEVPEQNAVESIGSAGAMAGPVVSGLAFHAWGFPGPFLVTASAYAAALIASGILFACRPTAEQSKRYLGSRLLILCPLISTT